MTARLQDRVAIITGAATGIGAETAKLFAAEGARLLLVDLKVEAGEALANQLRAQGTEVIFRRTDISSEVDVAAMVDAAVDHFGRIDCGFNNAGISPEFVSVDQVRLEDWQRVIAVNLTGTFLCMKHQLRVMRTQRSGAIVNTSSSAGAVGFPHLASYSAAKHGVIGLTKVAALENAELGIRVNAVLPGLTDTPLMQQDMDAATQKAVIAQLPGKRAARSAEIAEAVLWLCSDAASYVSGASINVDLAALAG